MTKTTAQVRDVVDALVAAALVDQARSDEARGVVARTLAGPARRETAARSPLVEIAGYVGGGLVVVSLFLFLAQQWADLSETVQVAVLAGIAVLLGVAGVVVSRVGGGYAELADGRDEVRRRLSAALLTGAALAAAFTVGRVADLAIDEPWSDWPGFLGSATMLLLSIAAYRYVPSVLGQLAIAGATFAAISSGWAVTDVSGDETLWPGLTLVLAGVVWVLAVERGAWVEAVPGRAIGAAMALFGAQMVVFEGDRNEVGYALMAAMAVAAFVLYTRTVSWPYLVVGVLGVTLVVPQAIIDWTGDSLGPAGAVLVAGLTLLAASLTGFRLRQEATEDREVRNGRASEAHVTPRR